MNYTPEQEKLFTEVDALVTPELAEKILRIIHPNDSDKQISDEVEFFNLSHIVKNHLKVMELNRSYQKDKGEAFESHRALWISAHEREINAKLEDDLKTVIRNFFIERSSGLKD